MGLFSTTINGSSCDMPTAPLNLVRGNKIFGSHVNIEGFLYVTRYHSVSLETIGKCEGLIE